MNRFSPPPALPRLRPVRTPDKPLQISDLHLSGQSLGPDVSDAQKKLLAIAETAGTLVQEASLILAHLHTCGVTGTSAVEFVDKLAAEKWYRRALKHSEVSHRAKAEIMAQLAALLAFDLAHIPGKFALGKGIFEDLTTKKLAPQEAVFNHAILLHREAIITKSNPQCTKSIFEALSKQGYHPATAMLADMYRTGCYHLPADPLEAIRLSEIAIENGNVHAITVRALMYLSGFEDVPGNHSEALKLLLQAAERGDCEAMVTAASIMLEGGDGVQKDVSKAIELLQKACKKGDEEAIIRVSRMKCVGLEMKEDKVGAVLMLQNLTRMMHFRNPRAFAILGSLYEDGYDTCQPNFELAYDLYLTAADTKEEAIHAIAAIFQNGSAGMIESDPDRAVRVLRRAVEEMDQASLKTHLGILLEEGFDGFENIEEAASLYQEAITQDGEPEALVRFSAIVEKGYGRLSPDPLGAVLLLRRAMDESNYAMAAGLIGRHVENGYGSQRPDLPVSARLYRRAVDGGADTFLYDLARVTAKGYGPVHGDPAQAAILYRRCINEEHDRKEDALVALAYLILKGYDEQRSDVKKAVRMYQRVCKKTFYSAMFDFAWIIEHGALERPPDPEQADILYQTVICDSPDDEALFERANIYEHGRGGIGEDPAIAVQLYRRQIEKRDDTDAMRRLAIILIRGADGVSVNTDEAESLLRTVLSRCQCAISMRQLADIVLHKPDHETEAVELYRQAAELGNYSAMNRYGLILESGTFGTEIDHDRAIHYFFRAEIVAGTSAIRELASLRREGFCTAPDIELTAALLERAVCMGCIDAMEELAQMKEEGYGCVPRDAFIAAALYKQVAQETGSVSAMSSLAWLLESEESQIEQDLAEAERLYARVIEEDPSDAWVMYRMGYVLERQGFRNQSKIEEAAKWYRKAVQLGEDLALFRLACVIDDVDEAEDMLRKCLAEEEDAAILFKLGELVEKRGGEEADVYYERALALLAEECGLIC